MQKQGQLEPLVPHEEVAAYLGKTPQGLYIMNHRGEGPPRYKIGARVMYRLSEVDAWLAEQRVADGAPA